MTVVATVLDVVTPANTLILTSVDASQNIVVTHSGGAGTSTVDGDVFGAALRSATNAPSGKEAQYEAATTVVDTLATTNLLVESETTSDEVTVTFVGGAARRVNADELSKAIQNALND